MATKDYPMPAEFDGAKFALKYKLSSTRDFWVSGGRLFVPSNLPDDPPIFEPPNPPAKPLEQRVADLEADVTTLKEAKAGAK